MFYDFERDIYYSHDELKASYEILKANGDTEAETFEEYVRNCTDGNGSLEMIPSVYTVWEHDWDFENGEWKLAWRPTHLRFATKEEAWQYAHRLEHANALDIYEGIAPRNDDYAVDVREMERRTSHEEA